VDQARQQRHSAQERGHRVGVLRYRIARERQDEARMAVVRFVERACGSAALRERTVASWIGQRASA